MREQQLLIKNGNDFNLKDFNLFKFAKTGSQVYELSLGEYLLSEDISFHLISFVHLLVDDNHVELKNYFRN